MEERCIDFYRDLGSSGPVELRSEIADKPERGDFPSKPRAFIWIDEKRKKIDFGRIGFYSEQNFPRGIDVQKISVGRGDEDAILCVVKE